MMDLQRRRSPTCLGSPVKIGMDTDLTFNECRLNWLRMNFAKRLCGMLTGVVHMWEAGGKGPPGLSGQIHSETLDWTKYNRFPPYRAPPSFSYANIVLTLPKRGLSCVAFADLVHPRSLYCTEKLLQSASTEDTWETLILIKYIIDQKETFKITFFYSLQFPHM